MPTDDQVFDALCDVVTSPNLTPFRANMILLDHGVDRIVRAVEGTDRKLSIGIGVPGGAWQWGSLDNLTATLGI